MSGRHAVAVECLDTSTIAARRRTERALVSLATRLEFAPAAWRFDPTAYTIRIGGTCAAEVERALQVTRDDSLFLVSEG